MPAVEAMRLYVRTLEEEVPDWWPQHQAAGDIENGAAVADSNTDDSAANGTAKAAPAAEAAPAAAAAMQPPPGARLVPKSRSVTEVVVEGSWVSPYISSDKRPPPRYEHATALIGSELFVIGGNYGGWLGGWCGVVLAGLACVVWELQRCSFGRTGAATLFAWARITTWTCW